MDNQFVFPIKIKKLHEDVKLPEYATELSAGFDTVVHNFKEIYASSPNPSDEAQKISPDDTYVLLPPHSRLLVGFGYAVELPKGLQVEVRSRGGMSLKKGLVILNSPGTVDADYRGEICGILCNTGEFAIKVTKGDRVGQCVLMPYFVCSFEEVTELSETKRGEGAFGHTGMNITDKKATSQIY